VPDDSDDFPADSERQVETKKLWQRFRTDNCEVLRKKAHDVRNPRNTVFRGSQSSHAAVLKQFHPIESQRRAAARMESSAKGQKKVFNARHDSIFEEAASAPEYEFEEEAPTPTDRQFTILQNIDYVNYQLWRVEEDTGRKAILEKKIATEIN
jgi:hypothetical protein